MPAVTAAWNAIADVIRTAVNLPAGSHGPILNGDRFYHDGEVPASAAVGYYLFGQEAEDTAGFVNQIGDSATLRVHCWADTKLNASRLYEWLHGKVDGQVLSVEGHTPWRCTMRRLSGGPDTDGTAYQAIGEINLETLRG